MSNRIPNLFPDARRRRGHARLRTILWVTAGAALFLAADIALAPIIQRSAIQKLVTAHPDTTSYMRYAAARGHRLREMTWVPLSSIAPVAVCAVVLSEDQRYFEHGTLDYPAQRKFARNVFHGDFRHGFSGIPQQLARNLFLSPERTVSRKAKEYLLAHRISHTLTKDRLLELYLNVAEWGDGVWGIEAASQHYFGVSAASVTPLQAVLLASLLPAPRRELPFMLGPSASRRQEDLFHSLWKTGLLNNLELGASLDRVREWHAHARTSGSVRDALLHTTAIIGDEWIEHQALELHFPSLPLARACDVTRRDRN